MRQSGGGASRLRWCRCFFRRRRMQRLPLRRGQRVLELEPYGSPLCLLGKHTTTRDCASTHSSPSSQLSRGESAPAANAATWGGRTTTPIRTLGPTAPLSQAGPFEFSVPPLRQAPNVSEAYPQYGSVVL